MLTYAEHVSRLLRDCDYCYTMPYIAVRRVPCIQRYRVFMCSYDVTQITGIFLIHDSSYVKSDTKTHASGFIDSFFFSPTISHPVLRVRKRREEMERKRSILALVGLILFLKSSNTESGSSSGNGNSYNGHLFSHHHRQKRLLWITNDGRIALPPGTIMTITPTLALPFVRYPPYGFLSNMTVSLPFTSEYICLSSLVSSLIFVSLSSVIQLRYTHRCFFISDTCIDLYRALLLQPLFIVFPSFFSALFSFHSYFLFVIIFTVDFDKLGLTDNENPYGALPSAFDTTARDQGSNAAEFIATFVKRGISKREALADLPKNALYGGERALLYGTAEDMLANFGLNGKACLLRAICEVQGHPLSNFGLIGEMLKLFFT